jgi:shikimate dehydrogenase
MTEVITGPRRCAVLGSPIGHSLSPALHRAAYRALGLSGWSYDVVECDQDRLPGFVASCGPEWAGLSLTMPLKQAVLPLLTSAEQLVGQVGAANTLIFAGGGRHGYNTDVYGMTAALTGAGGQASVRAGNGEASGPGAGGASRFSPAVILGAGSTAAAALAALHGLGVPRVVVAVRDARRAGELLAAAARLGIEVRFSPFGATDLTGTAVLISAVPAGAADAIADQILAAPDPPGIVLDVAYHPWPSRLAEAACRQGAVLVTGLDLLVHQAARQLELMTGLPAPVAAMRAAGQDEQRRRGAGC